MRNADIIRLFELVTEGTPVYIDPPHRYQRAPVSGAPFYRSFRQRRVVALAPLSGVGPIACLQAGTPSLSGNHLKGLGALSVPQDGSGVRGETDVVCVSTPKESNPPNSRARPRDSRSPSLRSACRDHRDKKAITVAGTSGKSTVTAMIFEFLTACGKSPSLISGAPCADSKSRD